MHTDKTANMHILSSIIKSSLLVLCSGTYALGHNHSGYNITYDNSASNNNIGYRYDYNGHQHIQQSFSNSSLYVSYNVTTTDNVFSIDSYSNVIGNVTCNKDTLILYTLNNSEISGLINSIQLSRIITGGRRWNCTTGTGRYVQTRAFYRNIVNNTVNVDTNNTITIQTSKANVMDCFEPNSRLQFNVRHNRNYSNSSHSNNHHNDQNNWFVGRSFNRSKTLVNSTTTQLIAPTTFQFPLYNIQNMTAYNLSLTYASNNSNDTHVAGYIANNVPHVVKKNNFHLNGYCNL